MKLLTKKIKKQLLAADRAAKDPEIIVKFFNPCGAQTWLITSMEENEDIMWGLADLGFQYVEYGTISFKELSSVKGLLGLGIERDMHFDPAGRRISDFLGKDSINA